jgi:hypothetical protein
MSSKDISYVKGIPSAPVMTITPRFGNSLKYLESALSNANKFL